MVSCRALGWPPGGLSWGPRGHVEKALACWESLGVSWVVSSGPAGALERFLGPGGPPRAFGPREPPEWPFAGPLYGPLGQKCIVDVLVRKI